MGALPSGVSQEQFYGDASSGNRTDLQGGYQYVTLTDIINNFLLMYTGDDALIPATINRDKIIFHAKRGLQELNYDALQEIKGIEIDLNPNTLSMTLPEDFVNVVRVSWVDDAGYFHPLVVNSDTRIAAAYLQDSSYNYLYDGSGNVLLAAQNSYDQTQIDTTVAAYIYLNDSTYGVGYDHYYENRFKGRFGMETDKANFNGWYTIDKATGEMKFSTNIGSQTIVLEYISDGVESSDISSIRIHKFAEQALYDYIKWMVLNTKYGIQEYIIKRAKKDYANSRRTAKMRLNAITFDDIFQAMRGKDKTLK